MRVFSLFFIVAHSVLQNLAIDEHKLLREEWQITAYDRVACTDSILLHRERVAISKDLFLAKLVAQLIREASR